MTAAGADGGMPTWTWDLQLHKRLRHAYGDFLLDLVVRSCAQRLVLFGPSGAGKTLSLQLIAGLVQPDRGHVRVAGRTLYDSETGTRLTPQARRLAFVFQDYALFPHLTVRQNMAFSLALAKVDKVTAAAKVARAAEILALGLLH